MNFGTKAVHAGVTPDPSTGAIMTPIYQTSTYVQESPAKHKGYAYARGANPTRNALQKSIAALEDGKFGICFSSGMGATDAVIKLLAPGDEVITSNDLYGGSYRMFKKVYEKFGIKFHFIDLTDVANLTPHINKNTKLLWLETPSNPLMRIIDIEACASVAKQNNILVAVDNTFASPYLQNPLVLGADIVMHSVTKYLSGHSDVIMEHWLSMKRNYFQEPVHLLPLLCAVPGPQIPFSFCVHHKLCI
jgi:cystathionine gamma-lyase